MSPGGILTGPLPPALLLLYDVTNKASFDSIQVSGFLPGGGSGGRTVCGGIRVPRAEEGKVGPFWWLRLPVS